jgi:signal transduction histidine kinase/CheY-like chemotaxis protein
MVFQNNPQAVPFGVAALISGALAVFAWRRHPQPLARAFAVMMTGEAAWGFSEAMELVLVEMPAKRICIDFRVAGAIMTTLGVLASVLRFTGCYRWLKPGQFVAICAPALAMCLVAWTNRWHHLYWFDHKLIIINSLAYATPVYGPGFWIHFAYCYILVAASTILLARSVYLYTGVFRVLSIVVLFGVIFPWLVNIVDMSHILGRSYVDTAAMTFAVTGLAFLPAVLRYGLLDLTPVAWAVVVEGMSDPVLVIDRWGRVVELNPAAQRLVGRPYPLILGVAAARALSHWPALACRFDPIEAKGDASFAIEGPGLETTSSFDVRMSRLGDGDHPAGWVLVLRDITEHKRAEHERARMVREQAARAEAEAANRAKDRFLATLSHELRTPLTPVLATVTALLGESSTPIMYRTILDMIRRNIVLEARLIDDLLDISRISRGKLHLKRQTIDAHELVDQVLAICRDEFTQAQLRLELDIAASRHVVDADPIRLQQVLWNLLKNAIKFTPAGGTVTVRSRNRGTISPDDTRSNLVIEVSDTGIGIEPEILPRIFDIFEQGGISATRQYGGLGLGLTISRWIAEQHGGRLVAASAGAGYGATFTFEMPAMPAFREGEAQAEPFALTRTPQGISTSSIRPLKILLVEDNRDTLNYLCKILTHRGHTVRTANNLAAALKVAAEADFELLISDIELPDGSGLELMWTLRAQRQVPAIALSGYGSADDLELSRSAGFAEHLIKPIDIHRLDQAIQQVTTPALSVCVPSG